MIIDNREYKILVIEDNPGDFALVEDFLYEQFEAPAISQAKNFKEAKEILTATINKINVILLDLSLPDNTGEALIRDIINLSENIPVIVLTGYTDFSFGVKSLSLGIADYLLKDELTAMSLYKSIVYSIERKRSIAELEESEKRYSEVFHFSPLPMWVVDLDALKFLDVNKATIDSYGYTREEFLTMTLKDIRPGNDIPNMQRSIDETRLDPKKISRRVTVHKRKNGELRNVEVQFAQFDYKGKLSNIVIVNDITDTLNYIKAIEERNDQLQEISWIQSHIIRAPLSRIMGLIPLIENTDEIDTEIRKMLQYLAASANELDEVIKDITDKTKVVDYQTNQLKK